jgi:hypothetical protein
MPKFRKQPIDIPLVQGLSQQTDERMQAPGGMEVADNVYFEKDARLIKRPGFTQTQVSAVSGTAPGPLQKAFAYQDRAQFADVLTMYERGPNPGELLDRGPIANIAAPDREVISHDVLGSVAHCAVAVLDRYRVYAWVIEDDTASAKGELWAAVYTLGGALMFREQLAAAEASLPRLYATTSHFVLWWLDMTGGAPLDLMFARLDIASTPTAWSGATNFTAVTSDARYDACPLGPLSFVAAIDGANIEIYRLDGDMTITHNVTLTEDASQGIGIAAGATLAVGWTNATGLEGSIRDVDDLTSVVAPGSIKPVVTLGAWVAWTPVNATTWAFVYSFRQLAPEFGVAVYGTYSGTVTTTPTLVVSRTLWHFAAAAKPYIHNARLYCPMMFPSNATDLQSAFLVCELPLNDDDYLRPVCALANNGTAQFLPAAFDLMQLNDTAVIEGAGSWAVALPEYFAFPKTERTASGAPRYSFGTAGVTAWDFSAVDDTNTLATELGGALYLSGGVTCQYDGDVVHEVGFAYAPQQSWVELDPTAGAATYQYVCTYVWQDKLGQLHESSPSVAKEVTSAALPIGINVITMTCSQKHQPDRERGTEIAVRIYRTEDGGNIYYWVADIPNDKGFVSTDIYADSRTDADIAAGFPLYTDGGALPNSQCLASKTIAVWDNRLFISQADGVAHTKQWVPDRAVQFVADPTHTIDTRDADDVTGMAPLDDALVIAKDKRLFLVSGGGPTQLGQNPYAPPRAWNVENGVTDPRSLLLGGQGVYFQGEGGMYLAPRGYGPIQWLGKAARDVLDQYPVVAAATLLTEKDLACWALHDEAKANGILLLFDYERGAWTTWTLPIENVITGLCVAPMEAGGETITSLQMACSNSDEATIWADEGNYWDEDSDATLLGGHVVTTIEPQYLVPSGKVNGYCRAYGVRLRGELRDANGAKLMIEAMVDDDPSFSYATWWIVEGPAGMKFEREWVLPWPNIEAIKLRVRDVGWDPDPTEIHPPGYLVPTSGFAFNALTLDVAVRGGAQKPLQEAHRG